MVIFIYLFMYFHFQVPSLEHNNEVRGESLDLIKYIDTHFEGPSLYPSVRYLFFSLTFDLYFQVQNINILNFTI